ncbi:Uncharacterized protein APZ42_018871 [Daphnia magna]|uniref:Uncharacterized protein n=1 Tax=Daphnia magna TaxID=35525 RepID=A0A164YV93_9CRUS|nr:Uncharacterized protein APZ42_018871 [Daphnia magna]
MQTESIKFVSVAIKQLLCNRRLGVLHAFSLLVPTLHSKGS